MQLATCVGNMRVPVRQHQSAPLGTPRVYCTPISTGLQPGYRTCLVHMSRSSSCIAALALADPSSAYKNEESTKAATPDPRERTSVLQDLLDKKSKQQGGAGPQPTRGKGKQRWHASDVRAVTISCQTEAGRQAGALSAMLRTRSHADVNFFGVLGVYKALRVLALTNIFLGSHDAACSFTFASVSAHDHQARLAQLVELQRQSQMGSNEGGTRTSSRQQLNTAGEAARQTHTSGQSLPVYSEHQAVPGQMAEPVPPQPLRFGLNVWARPAEHPEIVQLPGKQLHILDFALDIRMEWRRCAYISFDAALSIADNIYKQLMYEKRRAGAVDVILQQDEQSHQRAPSSQQSEAPVVTGAPMQDGGTASTRQKKQRRKWSNHKTWPTVVFGADITQSTLVFIALSFVEQRLRQEQQPHHLVCTVLRHSALKQQRLDGRNGYLFKLELQPQERVEQVKSRHKLPRKANEQAASYVMTESTATGHGP